MNTYMGRTAVLACCAAILVGCGGKEAVSGESATAKGTEVVVLQESGFDAAIAKGVVLVDFWAPWCGPCRMQGPIVDTVAGQFKGKAVVAKLNVDNARQVSATFKITGIPTLIVFKDGKPVKRFTGMTSAEELAGALQAALAAP